MDALVRVGRRCPVARLFVSCNDLCCIPGTESFCFLSACEAAGHSAATDEAQGGDETQLRKCDVDEPRHARQTEMKEDRAGVDDADRDTEAHQYVCDSPHVV